jgi:hypothetical protein
VQSGSDVEFADARSDDVIGQFADLVLQCCLDVDRGVVERGPPPEGDLDAAVAFVGGRGHLLDTGDGRDDLLDNLRDLPFHDQRVGTLELGPYSQGRKLDAR